MLYGLLIKFFNNNNNNIFSITSIKKCREKQYHRFDIKIEQLQNIRRDTKRKETKTRYVLMNYIIKILRHVRQGIF